MTNNKQILDLVRQGNLEQVLKFGINAIDGLLAGLNDKSYSVPKNCTDLLAVIGKADEIAFQRLLKESRNANWKIREGCARALGSIEDPRALETLFLGFEDITTVRIASEEALGAIAKKDEGAFSLLLKGLKSTSPDFREDCIRALAITQDPRASEILLLILTDTAESEVLKCSCLTALEKIAEKDEKALRFLEIIVRKHESYCMEMGLEKTLHTIIDYLELIKGRYPEKKVLEIKTRLFALYRVVAITMNRSKEKIIFDLPQGFKQPKGPVRFKMLRQIF